MIQSARSGQGPGWAFLFVRRQVLRAIRGVRKGAIAANETLIEGFAAHEVWQSDQPTGLVGPELPRKACTADVLGRSGSKATLGCVA